MIKPAKEIVICEPANDKSSSGLQLAGEEKPEIGKVMAIGKGEPPIELKNGDIIVHRRYTENKILVQGKELNFIKFEDIVAVL